MQKKIFCICFVFLCIIGIYCGYSIENEQKNIVKEDEQLDYAKLAADENSQMENLLKENYEAVKPPESEKKEEVKSEKGDVKGIYFGHDHNNSFNGESIFISIYTYTLIY